MTDGEHHVAALDAGCDFESDVDIDKHRSGIDRVGVVDPAQPERSAARFEMQFAGMAQLQAMRLVPRVDVAGLPVLLRANDDDHDG